MATTPADRPEDVPSYRSQLTTGEDVVDLSTWAGSIEPQPGIAPRVRVGHSKWFNLLWLLPIGLALLLVAVAAAQGGRSRSPRHSPRFMGTPVRPPVSGTVNLHSDPAAKGLPIWVGIQHFVNQDPEFFGYRQSI